LRAQKPLEKEPWQIGPQAPNGKKTLKEENLCPLKKKTLARMTILGPGPEIFS
jgi:hypothetical protein